MIQAQELRDHADHRQGCGGRVYTCSCGYDKVTERLLRAAAKRLEATNRGYRERAALERKDEQDG